MEKARFFQSLAGIIAVVAVVGVSCSNPSESGGNTSNTCTKPSAPTGVSASALSTSSIKVTWSLVGGDPFYYNIYRARTIDGAYSSVGKSFAPPFNDTALTQATEYYYKIAAVNDCGEGAMSAITANATATTMSCQKPPTPTNVTAAALTPTSIKVSWDSIPVAAYYEIYRAASVDGTYGYIDSTKARTYTNAGLTVASTHYYKIVAKNDCGESDKSNYASATTGACPKPAAPANATATAKSTSSIEVSWDEVNTAITYKVYRSATSAGTYSPVGSTAGKSSTSYIDEGLDIATMYYYKITAESECDESERSSYAFATTTNCEDKPAAPTNIRAEALSSTDIQVSWDAVSNAKYYSIYTDQGGLNVNYYLVGEKWPGTSVTISGRHPSTTYNFKISSENDCGASEMSTSHATATTLACNLPILPKPTGVSATALSARSVKITWNQVSGAVYDVFRRDGTEGSYWTVADGRGLTGNSFTDNTVSPSTTYYYFVKALNACGESADFTSGDVITVITLCETPIPTTVKAEAKSSSSLEVSWDAVSGAVSYSVYRSTTPNGTYTYLDRVSGTTFTNTGLSSLTSYHYKVTAKTELCDESQMSERATGTTQ